MLIYVQKFISDGCTDRRKDGQPKTKVLIFF